MEVHVIDLTNLFGVWLDFRFESCLRLVDCDAMQRSAFRSANDIKHEFRSLYRRPSTAFRRK
jgi:hypothetical protein